MEYILIFISAIFVNNIVLSQFLGICPFLGVSKKVETAMGMGAAVAFVMTLATIVTYLLNLFAQPQWSSVSTDTGIYFSDRRVGSDGGNRIEEGFSCSVSGIGNLPSVDYN